jgi:hypothetical protein
MITRMIFHEQYRSLSSSTLLLPRPSQAQMYPSAAMKSTERIQDAETDWLSVVIYLDLGYYQLSPNINLTVQFWCRRYQCVLWATPSPVRDLRFSQRFCWRNNYAELWRCTVWMVVPEIFEKNLMHLFSGSDCVALKLEAKRSFEISGSTAPKQHSVTSQKILRPNPVLVCRLQRTKKLGVINWNLQENVIWI